MILDTMKNPLFNQHILEKIFEFCKVTTLLQCRLVSKLWEEESNRILKKKAKITLGTTEDMLNLSTALDTFTCPLFSTFLIQFLSADQSSIIFEILGKTQSSVKQINFQYQPQSLDSSSSLESEETAESSQYLKLPQVESLHLFSTQFAPLEETLCMPTLFEKLNLPNLKSLTVIHLHDTKCTDTIIKLINSSKQHLEKLKIPCTKLLDVVRETNLKELKELDLCELFHGSLANNQTLQTLMSSCPKLRKLNIELAHRVTNPYLHKLFLTLSSTLENLKLTIQDKAILSRQPVKVDLRFPSMSKLKILYLRFSNPGLAYYIDNLPQLHSIELDTPWQKKVRGDIIPGGGTDKNVYSNLCTLKLSETLTVNDVENVSKSFPNLKFLGCSFENNEALAKVFEKFKSLERILIERRSNISDAGICGLPEDEIETLAKEYLALGADESSRDAFVSKYNHQRQMNFIGNLTNLKTLEFCQHGLTWTSLIFGVLSLTDLRTLTIQTTTLKVAKALTEDDSITLAIKRCLPMLANLTLWIRHHDEKLNGEECSHLHKTLSPIDVNILATICSV